MGRSSNCDDLGVNASDEDVPVGRWAHRPSVVVGLVFAGTRIWEGGLALREGVQRCNLAEMVDGRLEMNTSEGPCYTAGLLARFAQPVMSDLDKWCRTRCIGWYSTLPF